MAASVIGKVKSSKGENYDVKWDSSCGDVYVSWGGWSNAGNASSASEAMNKAEAYLYNK